MQLQIHQDRAKASAARECEGLPPLPNLTLDQKRQLALYTLRHVAFDPQGHVLTKLRHKIQRFYKHTAVAVALNGEDKEDARVVLQDGSLLQPPLPDLSPFLPVEETPAAAVAGPDENLLLVQGKRDIRRNVLDGAISQEAALAALSQHHHRSVFDTEVVAGILQATSLPLPVVSVAPPQGPTELKHKTEQEHHVSVPPAVPVASAAATSEPTPPALRILKEYWGPKTTGRNRFAQRLFKVLFADGSKENLVAEDVVDGWDQPFEANPFYSNVLREWRQEHPSKPVRPL